MPISVAGAPPWTEFCRSCAEFWPDGAQKHPDPPSSAPGRATNRQKPKTGKSTPQGRENPIARNPKPTASRFHTTWVDTRRPPISAGMSASRGQSVETHRFPDIRIPMSGVGAISVVLERWLGRRAVARNGARSLGPSRPSPAASLPRPAQHRRRRPPWPVRLH